MMIKTTRHNLSLNFLSTVFLATCLLFSSYPGLTQDPTEAVVAKFSGSNIKIRKGSAKKTFSVRSEESKLRKRLDTLIVPGDRYSSAGLKFNTGDRYGKMLVETIPQDVQSTYMFPCSGKGGMTIAWKKGGQERACNAGVRTRNSKGNYVQREKFQINEILAKNKALIVQDTTSDELLIQPGQESTIVRFFNTETNTDILVVLGTVRIVLPDGNFINLTSGQKYSSQNQEVTSFDRNSIIQSEDFQKFLDPDSWLDPSDPDQDLKADLEDKKLALGLKKASPNLSPISQELLDAHNQCRSKVGVPALKWSSQIAIQSQEWADYLSKTGKIEHRGGGGSGFGENLAAGGMSPTGLVNMWCDEQSNYDPQSGQCREGECGHFTQVVWKRTTELGCGLASHPRYEKVLVCNYNPPGNFNGEKPY